MPDGEQQLVTAPNMKHVILQAAAKGQQQCATLTPIKSSTKELERDLMPDGKWQWVTTPKTKHIIVLAAVEGQQCVVERC